MSNPKQNNIYLILENIRSILNVGAIFRTAEAAGVKKIFLCGITGYPSRKDIKFYDGVDVYPVRHSCTSSCHSRHSTLRSVPHRSDSKSEGGNPEINFLDWIPDQVGDDGIIEKYIPTPECFTKSLEKRIAKTALKALGNVDFEYRKSATETIRELKKNDINIIALEQDEKSIDYCKYDYKKPLAIVIGNEIDGVSKEVLDNCDAIVEIPMYGEGKSLNLATATGIIVYKAIETL